MIADVSIKVKLGSGASALEIGSDCQSVGLFWNDLSFPNWEYRYTYAPPSSWIAGNVLLGVVPESSAVPMRVVARGNTIAQLEYQKSLLNSALSNFTSTFEATALVEDTGESVRIAGPWQTYATMPNWGPISPSMLGVFAAEGIVSIPVNPSTT